MLLGWMVSVGHHLGQNSSLQSPLSTTSSINWNCSSDSTHGCQVIKNVLRKRIFHNIIIIITRTASSYEQGPQMGTGPPPHATQTQRTAEPTEVGPKDDV